MEMEELQAPQRRVMELEAKSLTVRFEFGKLTRHVCKPYACACTQTSGTLQHCETLFDVCTPLEEACDGTVTALRHGVGVQLTLRAFARLAATAWLRADETHRSGPHPFVLGDGFELAPQANDDDDDEAAVGDLQVRIRCICRCDGACLMREAERCALTVTLDELVALARMAPLFRTLTDVLRLENAGYTPDRLHGLARFRLERAFYECNFTPISVFRLTDNFVDRDFLLAEPRLADVLAFDAVEVGDNLTPAGVELKLDDARTLGVWPNSVAWPRDAYDRKTTLIAFRLDDWRWFLACVRLYRAARAYRKAKHAADSVAAHDLNVLSYLLDDLRAADRQLQQAGTY